MGQTKTHSILEVIMSTIIGFIVAVVSQYFIFPAYGIHVPLSAHIGMGGFFTIVSIIRGYLIRRFWNWVHIKSPKRL